MNDDITIQPPPIKGWPITDYRLETWNGLPHPNRASELLRWASDLAPNEYLKAECLAASQTVAQLSTLSQERDAAIEHRDAYKAALERYVSVCDFCGHGEISHLPNADHGRTCERCGCKHFENATLEALSDNKEKI